MNIGQAIRQLRQEQDLTQVQLAERCGLSVNAVSALETGKTYPTKTTIEKLCHALGISQAVLQVSTLEESDFPEEKRVLYEAMLKPLKEQLMN